MDLCEFSKNLIKKWNIVMLFNCSVGSMEVQELRSRCEEQSANLSTSVSSDMVILSCNYCC